MDGRKMASCAEEIQEERKRVGEGNECVYVVACVNVLTNRKVRLLDEPKAFRPSAVEGPIHT